MIADLVGAILLSIGAGALLLSVVAFIRFPDALSRIHAAGLAGSIGFPVLVLGLMLDADNVTAVLQYAGILLLGPVASATVAQVVAWAYRHRLEAMRAARERRGR